MFWESWESHSAEGGHCWWWGRAAPTCFRFSQRDHVTFLLFTCLAAMDMKILGGFHLFSKVMDNILSSLSYRDVVITKYIKSHLFVCRITASFGVWSGHPLTHMECADHGSPLAWGPSLLSRFSAPCPLRARLPGQSFSKAKKAAFHSQRLED